MIYEIAWNLINFSLAEIISAASCSVGGGGGFLGVNIYYFP